MGPMISTQWGPGVLGLWDVDGTLDLVLSDNTRATAWKGAGGGSFSPADSVAWVPASVEIGADMTGDGCLDAVALSGNPRGIWILPNATGPASSVTSSAAAAPRLLTTPSVTSGAAVRVLLRGNGRGSSDLPQANLGIWDVRGRHVRSVQAGAGWDGREGIWDLRDGEGRLVPSGMYWITSADGRLGRARMVVLR